MAILIAGETHRGRGASDGDSERTYTRVFRVISDNRYESTSNVFSAPGISRGDTHPDDAGAWCIGASARNGDSPYDWDVTFDYSSKRERNPNPLDEPAQITWSDEQFQRPLIVDKDGDAVVNTAGDAFDPPHMIDDSRLVATVTKNVATVPTFILAYRNVVNSDTFNLDGIAVQPGYAKIKAIHVSAQQEQNNVAYRTLTMPIHLNEDGWDVKLLNMGMYQKIAGVKFPCWISGKSATVPVPLNADGTQNTTPTAANVHVLTFSAYSQVPFSALPLS